MRLHGKSAIVTGGASGFGAGIARKFVDEGARTMIADINARAARDLAETLGPLAVWVAVDISKGKSVAAMAEEALAEFGHLDILVNNAGVTHLPKALERVSERDFNRVIATNTKSVFLTARALVPHMKERQGGVILNIASTAASSPRPRLTWYNASKGWIATATRSMAIELAEFGIRVNAISPVAGETPLLASFMGEDTPEIRAKFLATIPLGRFSTPQDIGNAACYLCSDEASMVTGAVLPVDGGRTI